MRKNPEIFQPSEEQVTNFKIERMHSCIFSELPETQDFLYGLSEKIKEKYSSLNPNADITKLFSHSDKSSCRVEQLHGSLMDVSPELFRLGPIYFDVKMTAITNAIFQDGLLDAYKSSNEQKINLSPPPEIEFNKSIRVDSELPIAELPSIPDLGLSFLEIDQLHIAGYDDKVPRQRGGHIFDLKKSAFTDLATEKGIPVITGISGCSFAVFKFLCILLDLNVQEMKMLRNCLAAYLVKSSDHSLYEVLEGVNLACKEEEFLSFCNLKFGKNSESALAQLICDASEKEHYSESLNVFEASAKKNNSAVPTLPIKLWAEKNPFKDKNSEFYKLAQKNINLYCRDAAKEGLILAELDQFFDAIKMLDEGALTSLYKESIDEHSVTNIDTLIELYCASRLSSLDSKVLGNGDFVRGVVNQDTVMLPNFQYKS
jgi:hypothetical protein